MFFYILSIKFALLKSVPPTTVIAHITTAASVAVRILIGALRGTSGGGLCGPGGGCSHC